MKYRTVIFDMDGTLVDSKINFPAIYEALRIDSQQSIVEYVNTLSGLEQQKAKEIVHFYEEEGSKNSSPIPGVQTLISKLQEHKINLGVFTLNSRQIAVKTLQAHGLEIPLVISREDTHPKPHPEGLLKICNHFSTSPHQAIYVGDYKYDLMAGKNANIKTAIYCPRTPDFDITDAYMTFQHFDELNSYLFNNYASLPMKEFK